MTWSGQGMARIADRVRARTGLVFPPQRRSPVEQSIRQEMGQLGIDDPARYLARIDADAVARDALVARLTVGESYFFRDTAQFDVIRERVLPELLVRDPGHRIRCWSAGCAAGEEAYSLAILLEEHGVEDAFILGTDIARPRLLQAERGDYSAWSLRGMPGDTIDRYFRREGNRYRLRRRIRDRVRFGYLNLAEDRYPSLGAHVWGMDLVLCRNVLIYFDPHTAAEVAGRLLETLTPGGWLLLGATDPVISEVIDCEPVLTAAGLAYRRADPDRERDLGRAADPPAALEPEVKPQGPARAAAPPLPTRAASGRSAGGRERPAATRPEPRERGGWPMRDGAVAQEVGAALKSAHRHYRLRRYQEVADAASRALAGDGPGESELWVIWARALANVGATEEAARVTARALEQAGPTAELLYLESVLHAHAGRFEEAASAARRALYLDRGMVVAHLAFADAQSRLHRPGAARRALRNAAELLVGMEANDPVPAADGETAGRLAELVRVRQRLLDEAS